MLKIINNMEPFFKDNYRRINVREYARLRKISPPTASKLLENLNKEGLLKKMRDRQYIYYYSNKESELFIDFLRIFWKITFEKARLTNYIEEELLNPVIILFGSLSKAEARLDSDIDIAVFTPTKKELNLNNYEKYFKRKIQVFTFQKRSDIKNKGLLNNILNGYKIRGSW